MSIAVVFPGQGAQTPGMGLSLYKCSAAARALFDRAGEEIKSLCFSGSSEELTRTLNAQPCLFTVGAAAFAALCEARPDAKIAMAAGHSLGEYTALYAAGVIDFDTGLSLVKHRAALMEKAAAETTGGMCAVMGDAETVAALTKTASAAGLVLPVNFNTPNQTVVAGEPAALAHFASLANETGLRVVPLKVGGAFHSPLMAGVADALADILDKTALLPGRLPIYANVTGQPYGTEIAPLLAAQAKSPVQWVVTVQNMVMDGANLFIELGVGSVLRGLIRKTARGMATCGVVDEESLAETVRMIGEES